MKIGYTMLLHCQRVEYQLTYFLLLLLNIALFQGIIQIAKNISRDKKVLHRLVKLRYGSNGAPTTTAWKVKFVRSREKLFLDYILTND